MNQYIDEDFNEPQSNAGKAPVDLSYWAQLGESYQPEWFPLGPAWMPEEYS